MITETKLAIVGVVSAATSILAAVSEQVQMALIAAIAAAVTAIPAIIIALRGTNKKIDDAAIETKKHFDETKLKVEEKASESQQKLEKVSEQLDGRLSKLIEEVSAPQSLPSVATGGAAPVKIESPTPVPVIMQEPKQ